jgi:hypothetical protein
MNTQEVLNHLPLQVDDVKDERLRDTLFSLLNLIDALAAENNELRQENQRLRDEINRLKGEQGKPNISGETRSTPSDISSERERKSAHRSPPRRGPKKGKIRIDRTEVCRVDRTILPPDAEFKGYERVVVQDVTFETDNVEFQKEVYYSPSQKQTYMAPLPPGYTGEFGPRLKSIVLIMKNVCNMSEPKILEFFTNQGIHISAGSISNLLIKHQEVFHQEKDAIVRAGLASSVYQQLDETSARVNGQNHHTHILCNPLYTAYITTETKSRLSALSALQNGTALRYCLTEEALHLLEQFQVAHIHRTALAALLSDECYDEESFEQVLREQMPSLLKRPLIVARVKEAAAIAAYHQGSDYPIVPVLVWDDAPQFKALTHEVALCWVHDGRFYKKLRPVVPYYAQQLEAFLTSYWAYYHKLLDYKAHPSPDAADQLSQEFDHLFSTQTGYQDLDDRLAKTKAKKSHLLLVLTYPELPLHNNASELGARVQVRKRDVSLHTMTAEGTQANDTFLTIVETCKKLSVNAYEYIVDRMTQTFKLPSLAQLIRDHSEDDFSVSVPP